MALLNLQGISLAFGGPLLLDNQDFHIEPDQKIGLVGRNGVGKSSLLKILHGELQPDQGTVMRKQGLRTALLCQDPRNGFTGTVYEMAARGLGPIGDYLAWQHGFSSRPAPTEGELESLSADMEQEEAWKWHQGVSSIITRLGLDPNAAYPTLSGGFKRRAHLAEALACAPDLLLLDEPTNHLDIDTITWLEEHLRGMGGSMVFITHDRVFLSRLATRIVELDRGRLMDWACDYPTFLDRKQKALENEEANWQRLDRKLAEEEVWLRKGLKARRTRNEGRVRALMELRALREERRGRTGSVTMLAQEAGKSGKLVAVARDVAFSYSSEPLIKSLNTIILHGEKIGIMGPNGSGKTTLLRLLLGELEPKAGVIERGSNLHPAYFDQLRETLDQDLTVAQNLNPDSDNIIWNGRQRHVVSYLRDFLFSPERAASPVRILSGGERNRLLLAKLFIQPSNLLVLDEPTNDLDAETLELLEALLVEYTGTVLLVSHDRAFINNVVTSTLVMEPEGVVTEYAGGYEDWLSQRATKPVVTEKPAKQAKPRPRQPQAPKLTWKQERELESLPLSIERLEAEQESLQDKMADPAFYKTGGTEINVAKQRLEELETELDSLLERWEELESIKKAGQNG